jgi:hypothetical protein
MGGQVEMEWEIQVKMDCNGRSGGLGWKDQVDCNGRSGGL